MFRVEDLIISSELPDSISSQEISKSYVFVLDQSNHLLLHYDEEWVIPSCSVMNNYGKTDKQMIKECVKNSCGLDAEGFKFMGYERYMKEEKYYFITRDIPQYSTFYMARVGVNHNIVDEISDPFSNLDMCLGNICQTNNFISYSKLITTTVYKKYKKFIDIIYQPLKINLISDIDRTLLVSCYAEQNSSYVMKHSIIPDHIINQDRYPIYVWLRPNIYTFLENVSNLTHLSYWTASSIEYQEKVITKARLDKFSQQIHYVDACSYIKSMYCKSIDHLNHILCDSGKIPYDLNKTLLLDDVKFNGEVNPNNFFPIDEWDILLSTSKDDLARHIYDDSLGMILSDLKYITDEVIHYKRTIPQILKDKILS